MQFMPFSISDVLGQAHFKGTCNEEMFCLSPSKFGLCSLRFGVFTNPSKISQAIADKESEFALY